MNLNDDIRSCCAPLQPQATDLQPRLQALPGIRAVLFDIYGTLVISASGDIAMASDLGHGAAFTAAMDRVGIPVTGDPAAGAHCLTDTIRSTLERLREDDLSQPEVDIRRCWRTCLQRCAADGIIRLDEPDAATIERIAVNYECRINPVWSMPGAAALLERLRDGGLQLGIISNAQFYTPLLFPVLLGASLGDLGMSADLCWFSYAHGRGKPDFWLYQHAAAALRHHGLAPHQALYIGNDMRNDIWPAAELGMRTALFAGDARSLRLREDHPQAARVTPDCIITDLAQIDDCLA